MRVLRAWTDSLSTGETNELCLQLATWHLGQVHEASPERERIAAGLASRDYRSLCDVLLDYTSLNPLDSYHLRQIQAFYQKREDLDFGVDREAKAFEKFTSVERHCAATNDIFRKWARGQFFFRPRVEAAIYGAQRKIATILGDVPRLADLKFRFGPGSTTQVKKRDAHPLVKLGEPLACSKDMLGVLPDVLHELSGWVFSHQEGCSDTAGVTVEIVDGRIAFVPKNFETDRTIGQEPSLNMMVQLAYGDYIADRLLKFGIDLTDQTKNQRLAREGSITGALATSDQSSASDCGAMEFVWHMLPVDWGLALVSARTSTYTYEEQTIKLQKWSSMGNGYTFPLESLYFYAIAAAASEIILGRRLRPEEISVFGDDIVIPTTCYEFVSEVLLAVGFLPNHRKSFASGPFRESCGTDWFSGINIRPAYLGSNLDGPSLFVLHNFYVRNRLDEPAQILRDHLHTSIQLYGPDGYGDGHLLGPHELQRHHGKAAEFPRTTGFSGVPKDWRSSRYTAGLGGYTFDTFTLKSVKKYLPLPGDCVYPSYCVYARHPWEDTPQDKVIRVRPGWFYRQDRRRFDPIKGWATSLLDTPAHSYDDRGRISCVFPGHRGYKRISIYTLTPPE